MCGIVACSGIGNSQDIVIEGLSRMQYRGYDSYGFAYVSSTGGLEISKSVEGFDTDTISLPDSQVLVGHTRWATHGAVNLKNSHPHVDALGRFALVHNGIVDNFSELKDQLLEKGIRFATSTDTEVVLHLMSEALSLYGDRLEALKSLQQQIEGRNTLLFLFADGELLGIRQGSPLVIGQGENGLYLASDILAFANQTYQCLALDDGQMVSIRGQQLKLISVSGQSLQPVWQALDYAVDDRGLCGYSHFMLKEIQEQWHTIAAQMEFDQVKLQDLMEAVCQSGQVLVTGAGGAAFTARQIAWLLRTVAGVKAIDVPAYEIEHMSNIVAENDLLIAVSQSGETADTLQAIQSARDWGLKIVSLVNMPMSTMTRVSDIVFYNQVGPEECVLSTKSASAQITFGYILATYLAGRGESVKPYLDQVSCCLSEELAPMFLQKYRKVAAYLAKQDHLFVLGRGQHLASAMIGALNIKEASYLHAEAFSAGELKHGVIALIEPGLPVIIFMPENDKYMFGVAAEVKARGAHVIALTNGQFDGTSSAELFDTILPLPAQGSLPAAIIPCQLLAYYTAIIKGLNPDRPRNLAKSVTVQ